MSILPDPSVSNLLKIVSNCASDGAISGSTAHPIRTHTRATKQGRRFEPNRSEPTKQGRRMRCQLLRLLHVLSSQAKWLHNHASHSSASILLRHDGSFARIDRPRSSCLLGSELSWAICPCPSTVSVRRARRARPARDSVSPSLVSCTAAAVSDSLWEPSLPALLAALLSLQTRLVRPRCASVPLQGPCSTSTL